MDFTVDAFLRRLQDSAQAPLVMGILNLTPDSFSDGGRWLDARGRVRVEEALEEVQRMAGQGAELIDLGGESTRPGALPPTPEEELERVLPLLEALREKPCAFISVDTQRAEVARRAADLGAVLVNDVGAGGRDAKLWPLVAERGLPYVLMHMQGQPQDMQRAPRYGNVVAEVEDFQREGVRRLEALGLDRHRILVDPGIGFGKNLGHNRALLRELSTLPGTSLMVGASRKRFIAGIEEAEKAPISTAGERLGGSVAAALWAARQGARVLRVHDVADTVQALRVWRWLEA